MLALTLWRPWAAGILLCGKDIENRPWPPPPGVIGKRILLHNGKRWDPDGAADLARVRCEGGWNDGESWVVSDERQSGVDVLEPGRIVGCVRVLGAMNLETGERRGNRPPPDVPSPWAWGPWCWALSEPVLLPGPLVRGAQMLWQPPLGIERGPRWSEEALHIIAAIEEEEGSFA